MTEDKLSPPMTVLVVAILAALSWLLLIAVVQSAWSVLGEM